MGYMRDTPTPSQVYLCEDYGNGWAMQKYPEMRSGDMQRIKRVASKRRRGEDTFTRRSCSSLRRPDLMRRPLKRTAVQAGEHGSDAPEKSDVPVQDGGRPYRGSPVAKFSKHPVRIAAIKALARICQT